MMNRESKIGGWDGEKNTAHEKGREGREAGRKMGEEKSKESM